MPFHIDRNIAAIAMPAELIKSAPGLFPTTVQFNFQLPNAILKAYVSWNVIGFHMATANLTRPWSLYRTVQAIHFTALNAQASSPKPHRVFDSRPQQAQIQTKPFMVFFIFYFQETVNQLT